MKKTKRPAEGIFLSLLFELVTALGVLFFIRKWFPNFWLPALASDRISVDHGITSLLLVTGLAFVLVQGITGYFIWRFSDPTPERAEYIHGSGTLEITWTLVTGLILVGFTVWGLGLWRQLMIQPPPPNAVTIEVTGQQFQWNFRYPGPDGRFGRTDSNLISSDNPLGLDPKDPASRDDIVAQDEVYVPLGEPVVFIIRAKDVIHSFFLPNFRIKQDAVPGMSISSWFTPEKLGDYEIACAQLCGAEHFTMRGTLHVVTPEEFDRKMKSMESKGE